MRTYPTNQIRNVALVGHHGAGKTTLAEALLHMSGATNRMGSVDDANTVCDFDEEGQRRHMSVSLALAPIEHADHKINVIDTPGYADFSGDIAATLEVADLALFVISASDGIGVQTEVAWRMAEELGTPRAFFVNKLDRERASFHQTVEALKDRFGAGVAPVQLPIGQEDSLRGVVNLLADVAFTYDGSPTATEGPIPDEMEAEEHAVHDQLVEGIVVADDDLMERYLDDEKIEIAELKGAMASGIAQAAVFPVLCGSATALVGIDRLATFLVDEAPAPRLPETPASAVHVFKTIVDPYVGRVSIFRVLSGTVKTDDHLTNARSGSDERMHQLFSLRGKEQLGLSEIACGDIAAVSKLSDTATGDLLAANGAEVTIRSIERPAPVLATAIVARNKGDEDKLANALHRILDEDPALILDRNSETKQTLLRGAGETHLQIAVERLERKFGVQVDTEDVKVAYRETVASTAEAEGKYKKQTGGHGQFGVAFVRVAPRSRGEGFEFVDKIVGGAIPRQFIPAVEKGIAETMGTGGAFGYPVVDVEVTCYDGKYHSVDSSEMSFKMAGSIGFKAALQQAKPILLEPISDLVIVAPEDNQGDVMGDLNSKRGRITGTASIGHGEVEITAQVPTAEVLRYAIDLRSITAGRGRFTIRHSHYDPVPNNLVDRIAAAAS